MAAQEQEKKKTQKVTGRSRSRIAAHYDRAPLKKLRRVLKASGLPAGQAYAREKSVFSSASVNLLAEPRWIEREAAKQARAVVRRDRYAIRRAMRDADRIIAAARARDEGIETGESLGAI